ncbi:WG repeat-containing protein [Pseudobacteroides cellulosolvens]|nr:WG repeat-containing protein [Pseudobacteroides cellulosolvens]
MKKIRTISIMMVMLLYIPACQDTSKDQGISLTPSKTAVVEKIDKVQLNEKINYNFTIDPQYDQCDMPVDGIIGTKKIDGDNVGHGFIDTHGRVITDAMYDETRYYIGASSASSGFSQGLAPVKKNGKWGYIDMQGVTVIDFKFDDAFGFSDDLARVVVSGKSGYINKAGEIVITPQYDDCSEFHNGVAAAMLNNKYGFIGKNGEWIIKPAYDAIDFGRYDSSWEKINILQIIKDDLVGMIKVESGSVRILAQPKYTNLFPFYDEEAKFVILHKGKDGQFGPNMTEGYVNKKGREIFSWESRDEEGEMYEYLSEGMRPYRNVKKIWGFADKNFKVAIPCKYDRVEQFNHGFAVCYKGDKAGLIDKHGKVLLQPVYETIVPIPEEGYAIVQKGTRMQLISTNSFKPVSREYDGIGRGGKVLAVIEKGKVGFIGNDGRELAAPQYDECESFAFWEDYAWVKENGKWICVDQCGKQKFYDEFDGVTLFEEGLAAVKKESKWGVIDKNGNVVVPYNFEEAAVVAKDLIKVKSDGKYGFIKL